MSNDVEVVSSTEVVAVPSAEQADSAKAQENETDKSASETDELNDETADESDSSEEKPESEETEKESESEDEASEDAPKKKGKFKKRIDRLIQQRNELLRELEAARTQTKPAEAKAEKEPAQTQAVQNDEGPNPDDFETHRDYVKAVTEWTLDQKAKADEGKRVEVERQSSMKAFESRYSEFRAQHADFDELIQDVAHVNGSKAMEEHIIKSDVGPALMYELAKDPDELERIVKLHPAVQVHLLSEMESRLKSSGKEALKQPETKKTKAPAPIQTVQTGKTKVASKSLDQIEDYDEWKRERNKQLQRK